MPNLYVGNVGLQDQRFLYWLPEKSQAFMTAIPVGSQRQIPGPGIDLPSPVVDSIIEQHRRYGLCSWQEAFKQDFWGLVYAIEKPIPLAKLYDLTDRYHQILFARGAQMRKAAALATNEFTNQLLRESQQIRERRLPDRLNTLEMSVEQIDNPYGESVDPVEEGVRVTEDAEQDVFGNKVDKRSVRGLRSRR